MAQQTYKVNTTKSEYAYLSEDQTRTVISASGLEGGAENLPGIAYMHNVVPTKRGLQTISYELLASPVAGLVGSMIDVRIVYSLQRNRHYFCFTDSGVFYRLDDSTVPATWVLVPANNPPPVPYNKDLLSLGRVNGVTYTFYPGAIPKPVSGNAMASYYDEDLGTFVEVELEGTDYNTVIGISASSGYLIVNTQLAMAWSSTINPLDFIPSTVTGAGGGDVAGIAGNILFAVANSLGIIFYTQANAIAATYTGNVQFPFKFREVADSKGGINFDRIAYEANSEPQFVFTKAGVQSITSRKAETILPDLTDFLTGRRIETLDTTAWEYQITDLLPSQVMLKKVKYISSRYLLFSYGIEEFTHTILWDTSLEKTGKFLKAHTDIFEYTESREEVAKDTIAFLQADGTVLVIHSHTDPIVTGAEDQGVVVFGKLQGTRTRLMTLLGVEFEGQEAQRSDISCVDLASLTGARDFEVIAGKQAANSPAEVYRNYFFRKTAENHNIGVLGHFGINTFIVTYTQNGRR